MFTGLIEEIGTITRVERRADGRRLWVRAGLVLDDLALGASISLNGVCQTVTALSANEFQVDAVGDTLQKTTMGSWKGGEKVHLERACRADTRMGGHFVQGHVQTTGTVVAWGPHGLAWHLEVEPLHYQKSDLLPEGSIAVDGVSLTIAEVTLRGFRVSVIPETLRATTFATLTPRRLVNLEFDILARHAAAAEPSRPQLTEERLRSWGYA